MHACCSTAGPNKNQGNPSAQKVMHLNQEFPKRQTGRRDLICLLYFDTPRCLFSPEISEITVP
jgi:hypothetical protein